MEENSRISYKKQAKVILLMLNSVIKIFLFTMNIVHLVMKVLNVQVEYRSYKNNKQPWLKKIC